MLQYLNLSAVLLLDNSNYHVKGTFTPEKKHVSDIENKNRHVNLS